MSNGKEYLPPRGGEVVRAMARCIECSRWWSTDGNMIRCACKGELEIVDMAAHMKTLPYVPYDPSKK